MAWAEACTNSRAKYRRLFFWMFQLAATESRVTRPESTTRGAERPSAASDHSRPREGTQANRSTS